MALHGFSSKAASKAKSPSSTPARGGEKFAANARKWKQGVKPKSSSDKLYGAKK